MWCCHRYHTSTRLNLQFPAYKGFIVIHHKHVPPLVVFDICPGHSFHRSNDDLVLVHRHLSSLFNPLVDAGVEFVPHKCDHTFQSSTIVAAKYDERCLHSTSALGLASFEPRPTTGGDSLRHFLFDRHNIHATAVVPHDHDHRRIRAPPLRPSATTTCFHCARQL